MRSTLNNRKAAFTKAGKRNLAVARSIWPTGKPARPFAFCANENLCLACRAERRRLRVADVRARGIAEGRRLAARRTERFVAWLRESGYEDPAFAERFVSPEAAMTQAANAMGARRLLVQWVASDEAFTEEQRASVADCQPREVQEATRRLLFSPEWAALPWQREAGR